MLLCDTLYEIEPNQIIRSYRSGTVSITEKLLLHVIQKASPVNRRTCFLAFSCKSCQLMQFKNLCKSSEFQRWDYPIDHFHVPNFDSNGFCWMNTDEDLYFKKDRDQSADPNITSREIVCNFDRQGFHYFYRIKIFWLLVMKISL